MTYDLVAARPASEKVTICIAEATTQYKIFSVHEDDIFVKDVPYFISKISEDGEYLDQSETLDDIAQGQFFFDIKAKKLYLWTSDDANPKTKTIVATCKFFFADAPYNLPYDLDAGPMVEFEARINSIGKLGQELDEENTGIVLESASSVSLINGDGYFDNIFDTLIWENQRIVFHSWFPDIPINQNKKLFTGIIETKRYSDIEASFTVKDFIFRLKDKVNLGLFSADDGTIDDSDNGKAKRRIYGKVDQVQCTGITKTLKGYALTGTISIPLDSTTITGTGTIFLTQLSPGDKLYLVVDGEEYDLDIESISSNTAAVAGTESDFEIVNATVVVRPAVPYRQMNRKWHIAGHKLRAPQIPITQVNSPTRVRADALKDLFQGDIVKINSDTVSIKRISGNQIIFNQAISPLPVLGDLIEKNPVSKVYFGSKELIVDRDWTLHNTDEAWIELNTLAEFNIAPQRKLSGINVTFTNGSRNVTTSATIDLRTLVKPRDWIRKNSLTEGTWMEVLAVSEQSITLRINWVGTTGSTTAYYKSVDLIDDSSLITVNTLGMEDADGNWIKTASDAVRDLVLNDAGFEDINEASFAQAKVDCDYILSMAIPDSLQSDAPKIKDVVTNINKSVFGSLFGNQSAQISFAILNAYKPLTMRTIRDDDILDWSVDSSQSIVNKVKINYRPITDIFSGASGFKVINYNSTFVDRFIGIENTEERTLYLYEDAKALIIAQRIAFFKSLAMCKVTVQSKMDLSGLNVNDKMIFNFDRMYKRFGGQDRLKIGIVTGIKKDGRNTEVDFTDLGNIFNRVPAICPNDIPAYSSGTRDQIARYGYILDNDTLTPDNTSEAELGNNLIG